MRVTGLALATVIAIAAAHPARAMPIPQESDDAKKQIEPPAKGADDGRRTARRLPANFGRGFVGVFSRESLPPLVGGLAATSAALIVDDEIANSGRPDDELKELGQGFGNPLFVGVVATGMLLAGRSDSGQRFRDASYDIFVAAAVNLAYTELLKLAVHRDRPNGEDNNSFPSGHTSNAFTWATVLERHYGAKVGVPMYALAAVIGASRISGGKHYLSDVLAGATIGFVVGRSVTRKDGEPLIGTSVTVVPAIGPSGQRGLAVVIRF